MKAQFRGPEPYKPGALNQAYIFRPQKQRSKPKGPGGGTKYQKNAHMVLDEPKGKSIRVSFLMYLVM